MKLPVNGWPDASQWPNLLASLFYQHNIIFGTMSRIAPVAWSLEIEVQFYILAPLLAVIFSVRRAVLRRGMLLCAIVALPIVQSLLELDTRLDDSLPLYLQWFLGGFLLADFYLVEWNEAPLHSYWWDGVGCVGWTALLTLFSIGRLQAALVPLALVAYAGVFRGRILRSILTTRVATTIGGMCYSIYLLHYHVMSALGFLTKRLLVGGTVLDRLALNLLICTPAILVVSVMFFLLVERPCMAPEWPRQLAQGMRGVKFRQRQIPPGESQAQTASAS